MEKLRIYKIRLERNLFVMSREWPIAILLLLLSIICSLPAVSHAETPSRIISLSPGITEILFAAGLGDRVVGVTAFCDYPEDARSRPKVGGMTNPSLEAIIRLRPDVVIVTTDGNPREFEQRLRGMGIKTYVFESLTVAELPDGLRSMGRVLEAEKEFNTLASRIEQGIRGVKKGERAGSRKVLFIIWPEPLIVAGPGTAIDDAITMIGAVNISGKAKSRYPKYSVEEILRTSPDVIFIGKGMRKEHEDLETISKGLLKRIAQVKAVQEGRVYFVSDSLYRLGPRIIQGIEELERNLEGFEDSRIPGYK
jgi:iron complex transport system substrate-binding protein